MASKRVDSRRRSKGFTLIEMIIVITLIAAVMALVAGKVIQNRNKANYKLAQTQMIELAASIEQYQNDVGSLPDSLQQLVQSNAEGWLGPYARAENLKDPWKNPIEYHKPGDDDRPFSLLSLGVDGKPGGEGVDKDLVAP
jgi:general secretion pathway protein G